jgi:uncharacterized tellurite resistance protein B-like protein
MDGMPELSPLQALAIGTAYVVMADKKALPEERASLVSLLGKHVSRRELSSTQIQRLTADSFAYVAKYEYEKFLMSIEATLTPAQIISILSNMYEIMIVDGNVVSREKELIEEFFRFFDVDRRVVNTIREVLMVKNDTTLFLRIDHPNNSRDFRFGFLDRMDLDA